MGCKQGEGLLGVGLQQCTGWFLGAISEDYRGGAPQAWRASIKRLGEVGLVEKQLPQCRNNVRIGTRVVTVGNDEDNRVSYPTGFR